MFAFLHSMSEPERHIYTPLESNTVVAWAMQAIPLLSGQTPI
jgi:hypothetical protein